MNNRNIIGNVMGYTTNLIYLALCQDSGCPKNAKLIHGYNDDKKLIFGVPQFWRNPYADLNPYDKGKPQ